MVLACNHFLHWTRLLSSFSLFKYIYEIIHLSTAVDETEEWSYTYFTFHIHTFHIHTSHHFTAREDMSAINWPSGKNLGPTKSNQISHRVWNRTQASSVEEDCLTTTQVFWNYAPMRNCIIQLLAPNSHDSQKKTIVAHNIGKLWKIYWQAMFFSYLERCIEFFFP